MKIKSALVTGASSGIGLKLSRILAENGFDLALVARNQTRLETIAQDLSKKHGVRAKALPFDLSDSNAASGVFNVLQADKFPISILVNNAGFGLHGRFSETDLQTEMQMLQVNIGSLVQLTKLFLRPMLEQGEGKILNVASTAAFQPGPQMSIYYASKAFVYSFSCALALELKGSGVTVTTLCPGGTRTDFHHRAGMERTRLFRSRIFKPMDARQVAEIGYRALMKNRLVVVAGKLNALMAGVSKCSPTLLTAKVAGKLNEIP